MISGIDISAHDTAFSRVPDKADFVFIKATEGRTWTNRFLGQHVPIIRKSGAVPGFYHWLHKGNVAAQIDHFLEKADPQPGDVLIPDWEKQNPGTPNPTRDDKNEALQLLARLMPDHQTLLYCNASWWNSSDKKAGDGLWVAHYGVDRPGIAEPWLIHQYQEKPDWNRAQFDSRADMWAWARSKEKISVKWPSCAPFKEGDKLKVSTPAGLRARTAPRIHESTLLIRNGESVTVDQNYPITVRSMTFSDGIWIVRSEEFYYAACDENGKPYLTKRS